MPDLATQLDVQRRLGVVAQGSGARAVLERIRFHLESAANHDSFHSAPGEQPQLWMQKRLGLVDPPSGSHESLQRWLLEVDGAVFIIDGDVGIQHGTGAMWSWGARFNIPSAIFIDSATGSLERFLERVNEARLLLDATPLVLHLPIGSGGRLTGVIDLINMQALTWPLSASEEPVGHRTYEVTEIPAEALQEAARFRKLLEEAVAENDDWLLEKYFGGEAMSPVELRRAVRRLTIEASVHPVLCGSATYDRAFEPLLDAVVEYFPSPLEHDPSPELLDFAQEGLLEHELREPVVAVSIELESAADASRLLRAVDALQPEDPTFFLQITGERRAVIEGMGELHLDILVDRIRREHGVHAIVGEPIVRLKQRIEADGSTTTLSPLMSVEVRTPDDYVAAVVDDLIGRGASAPLVKRWSDISSVSATVPMSNMFGFLADLRSKTHGRAVYSMSSGSWGPASDRELRIYAAQLQRVELDSFVGAPMPVEAVEAASHDSIVEEVLEAILGAGYLDQRTSGTAILEIEVGHRRIWPKFQFRDTEQLDVHPEVVAVDSFLHSGDDPVGAVSWWLTKNSWLDESPYRLLGRGRLEELRYAAQQLSNDSW